MTPEKPFDWSDLNLVLAVLEERSLSRAARRLGLSQPTVGRRLSDLEERTGALVERTPRGCVATPLGAAVRPMLEAMRTAADDVTQATRTSRRDLSGTVRIACGEVVGRALAGELSRLAADIPGLELEIVVGMKRVNLERGDADIAIRSRAPTQANLRARKISRARFAIYGARNYLDDNPAAYTDDRYRRCRWVSFDSAQAPPPTLRWLLQRLPEPPAIRLSHTSLILEAVAAGAGLAVLSMIAGDADPRLERVTGPLPELSFDGYMVTHNRSRRVPRVRFVADALARRLGQISGQTATG
jgi:DNA-binding transcriptional LysR family regulator